MTDNMKPYHGLILHASIIGSNTGHVHLQGDTPSHPLYRNTYTSRIIKADIFSDGFIEVETRNSRYGLMTEDAENFKYFVESPETAEMFKGAEIEICYIDRG